MGRAIAAAITVSAASLPRPFAGFTDVLAISWHDLTRHLFNGYRPERHYMRGPGPAWRAKHGHLPGQPSAIN